jgi:hypothetical protein
MSKRRDRFQAPALFSDREAARERLATPDALTAEEAEGSASCAVDGRERWKAAGSPLDGAGFPKP